MQSSRAQTSAKTAHPSLSIVIVFTKLDAKFLQLFLFHTGKHSVNNSWIRIMKSRSNGSLLVRHSIRKKNCQNSSTIFLVIPLTRNAPRFGPGWRRRPGRPRHSWIQQIGDGTPFSIRAKWSKARRRGHSGLTQRSSAVYAI